MTPASSRVEMGDAFESKSAGASSSDAMCDLDDDDVKM
jgi:hypothetical protein